MPFLPQRSLDRCAQSGIGLESNQQFSFNSQVHGAVGTHATTPRTSHASQLACPPSPQPAFAQPSRRMMAVEQIIQTPHEDLLEQATHDGTTSKATDDTGSDSAAATAVDYSWHLVATQGDHAIFGNGGILHGTELKTRTTRNGHLMPRLFISPTLKHLCVPAGIHGHNNLEIGQWFANRTTAYFHGAHGAFQPGIVGTEDGAFSVVITPAAGISDVDHGYTVLYAVPEGHPGSRGLEKSHQTGNPVRVLRTAKKTGHWPWAPRAGIRYDGLYRVVGISGFRPSTASAGDGGTFRHFEMRRLPGQTPLEELRDISPSGEELDQLRNYHVLLDSIIA